jgi:malate dehydrogenase (oxaloacetate-decarboxylating)
VPRALRRLASRRAKAGGRGRRPKAAPPSAGAAAAADGTVVNNVLGYPGMFRGALLAGATAMTTEMKRAAAWAIAGFTVAKAEQLVPDVLDPEVHHGVAEAVRRAAIDTGVGSREEIPSALEAAPGPAPG